jgi:hypothetical protein
MIFAIGSEQHSNQWTIGRQSIRRWIHEARPVFENRIIFCHYKSIVVYDNGIEVQMLIQSLFGKSLFASERELASSTRRMIFMDQAICTWEFGSDVTSRNHINYGAWKNQKKTTIEPRKVKRLCLLLGREWDLRDSPVTFVPLSPKVGIAKVAYQKNLTFHEVDDDGEFLQRTYCVIGFGEAMITYQRGIKSIQKDWAIVLK